MSSPRWRTVHDRFQVLADEDGGELLDTRESRVEAEVLAEAYLEDFDAVLIYDVMARRGAPRLWRVTADGVEERERRPAR